MTTLLAVVILSNTAARLLLYERHQLASDAFVDLRIWRVPNPVRGSAHEFKYALAYVVAEECVMRYDNEAGKGDHKQVGEVESAYSVSTPEQLLADFWSDVDRWKRK